MVHSMEALIKCVCVSQFGINASHDIENIMGNELLVTLGKKFLTPS